MRDNRGSELRPSAAGNPAGVWKRKALRCAGGIFAKNTANAITALRILFAVAMLLAPPCSPPFWACYLCAGLSDIFDGIVARRLHQQSQLGAKLDSAADLIFAAAIAAVMIAHVAFPAWLWLCGACIALVRAVSYGVGYWRYHTFSALHTYANKAAGGMAFLFPLLNRLLGITVSGILLCGVAFISALEEFVITAGAKQLDRQRRGLFL